MENIGNNNGLVFKGLDDAPVDKGLSTAKGTVSGKTVRWDMDYPPSYPPPKPPLSSAKDALSSKTEGSKTESPISLESRSATQDKTATSPMAEAAQDVSKNKASEKQEDFSMTELISVEDIDVSRPRRRAAPISKKAQQKLEAEATAKQEEASRTDIHKKADNLLSQVDPEIQEFKKSSEEIKIFENKSRAAYRILKNNPNLSKKDRAMIIKRHTDAISEMQNKASDLIALKSEIKGHINHIKAQGFRSTERTETLKKLQEGLNTINQTKFFDGHVSLNRLEIIKNPLAEGSDAKDVIKDAFRGQPSKTNLEKAKSTLSSFADTINRQLDKLGEAIDKFKDLFNNIRENEGSELTEIKTEVNNLSSFVQGRKLSTEESISKILEDNDAQEASLNTEKTLLTIEDRLDLLLPPMQVDAASAIQDSFSEVKLEAENLNTVIDQEKSESAKKESLDFRGLDESPIDESLSKPSVSEKIEQEQAQEVSSEINNLVQKSELSDASKAKFNNQMKSLESGKGFKMQIGSKTIEQSFDSWKADNEKPIFGAAAGKPVNLSNYVAEGALEFLNILKSEGEENSAAVDILQTDIGHNIVDKKL